VDSSSKISSLYTSENGKHPIPHNYKKYVCKGNYNVLENIYMIVLICTTKITVGTTENKLENQYAMG
jgi:hypothetical protein